MVGVRGTPAADQAGLGGDEFEVLLVAVATGLEVGQRTLIDAARSRRSRATPGVFRLTSDDGWGSAAGCGSGLLMSARSASANVDNLATNAVSTCLASAAVKFAFAPSVRCAQAAASSGEVMAWSSPSIASRAAADAAGSNIFRGGLAETRLKLPFAGLPSLE